MSLRSDNQIVIGMRRSCRDEVPFIGLAGRGVVPDDIVGAVQIVVGRGQRLPPRRMLAGADASRPLSVRHLPDVDVAVGGLNQRMSLVPSPLKSPDSTG